MSKEDSEKLVKKVKEMSVEEQYADIYIEAELHTPINEMIRNTEIALAKEKAREEGLNEGIEQGIEQGLEQGIEYNKIEIAKNMLDKNMEINIISEITGLSVNEIELLK